MIVNDDELFSRLYFVQNATGAAMGPLESFLCSRGLKTLDLRAREQSAGATGRRVPGERLRVRRVMYPGLASHPGHAIAARQMDRGFGAVVSFELAGDFAAAKRFVEATRLFQLAVSLGSVESLIEQPASMSHASYDPADRAAHGIADGLIRLSIGLEAFEACTTISIGLFAGFMIDRRTR